MKLSEIAEFIVKEYPGSCIAYNNIVNSGCRDEWYEEYLIDPLMDYFSFEVMDMCGCGRPENTNEMIRKILNIRNEWSEDKLKYEDVVKRYGQDLKIDTENEIHYGLLQFVLYMLDSHGILEHGSSVSGSWLTKEGKMYLTVLNAWRKREDEEGDEVNEL